MELPGALFSPSWNNKKNPPRENFLCPNIKNFIYIFSAALIFQETEPPPKKKIIILSQKKAFLILWETEAPQKIFMLRKRYFLIFHEKELSELEKKNPL